MQNIQNKSNSWISLLEREEIATNIKQILTDFESRREDNMFKKGIYIYGHPGCGKTHFILEILSEMKFDVVKYDTGDIRNKALIETITKHNMSDRNVLSMMRGEKRKIAILMDEIDGMNNGDKGGITALIKLIRQKKTKKQKNEDITLNPIICIGNYHTDKKIRELMKVCNTFELKKPTFHQLQKIIQVNTKKNIDSTLIQKIAHFSQGDLRKLNLYMKIWRENPVALLENEEFFQMKVFNENTKKITESLINTYYPLEKHTTLMNETDRTIVALLWHENIVDAISVYGGGTNIPSSSAAITKRFNFYKNVLNNICFSDYIDRITFQNQIWQFNEMTSLIKTFYNNMIYHKEYPENHTKYTDILKFLGEESTGVDGSTEVRFTKVLTKYSTEYNNILFVYNLCQLLDMDQKDMFSLFQDLRYNLGDVCGDTEILSRVEKLLEKYDINKLFIRRIYRYLDKNVKRNSLDDEEYEEDAESDD